MDAMLPLSTGPIEGPTVVAPPGVTVAAEYASVGAVFAVRLTCKSPVPVRLPSETRKRTVPEVAVQDVLISALIVPPELVMPETVTPVAVPPAICITANDPAAVWPSATAPTVTAAPTELPSW